MTKIKAFIQALPIQIIFWSIVLMFVLMFWPVEAETTTQPQIIHIYLDININTPIPIEEPIEEPMQLTAEPIISPKYGFTDDDIYLMTVLLCGSNKIDGDGEYDIDFYNQDNHDQISLVLSVVMNRVMSDKFPNTVSEVIWAPGQFSPMSRWKNGLPVINDKSYQIVKKWCEAYDAHDLSVMSIPESHLYFTGDGVINTSRERW